MRRVESRHLAALLRTATKGPPNPGAALPRPASNRHAVGGFALTSTPATERFQPARQLILRCENDSTVTSTMSDIQDPIEFELFKNAIFAIADEMAVTICRTTYSGVLRDNMDFSTSLSDAEGRVIAQGLTVAMHLGAIETALASVLRKFEGDIHEGDVFIMNDPFDGGMHLPDVFIFKPIFVGAERVAFASTTAHQVDMGGRVPGSNAADSTEIYQEGFASRPSSS